ncbi:hypothetical protein MMC18_002524 [Xylographa bjoerkii]|nr:hypothetical protein [Xylographa bjoerkii]
MTTRQCISPDISAGRTRAVNSVEPGESAASPDAQSASSTSSKGPYNAAYRTLLWESNIKIDGDGCSKPACIQDLVDSILVEQPGKNLSDDKVASMRETIRELASSEEPMIKKDILSLALFSLRSGYKERLLEAADIPLSKYALPQKLEIAIDQRARPKTKRTIDNILIPIPILCPKPDYHYGYDKRAFNKAEGEVLDKYQQHAQPSTTSYLPFFAVEVKAQARKGTHWVAENQNAGNGVVFVHCIEQLYKHNGMSYSETSKEDGTKYSAVDSAAFSCCIDAMMATLWVHWHQSDKYNSAVFGTYALRLPQDIRNLYSAIHDIVRYGRTTRLLEVKKALARPTHEQNSEHKGNRRPKRKASKVASIDSGNLDSASGGSKRANLAHTAPVYSNYFVKTLR